MSSTPEDHRNRTQVDETESLRQRVQELKHLVAEMTESQDKEKDELLHRELRALQERDQALIDKGELTKKLAEANARADHAELLLAELRGRQQQGSKGVGGGSWTMVDDHVNHLGDLNKPQLRDPLTIAISFMPNPSYFRHSSKFTVAVFDQAVYLEGYIPIPYGTISGQAKEQEPAHDVKGTHQAKLVSRSEHIPISLKNLFRNGRDFVKRFRIQTLVCQHPAFGALGCGTLASDANMARVGDILTQCPKHLEEVTLQGIPGLFEITGHLVGRCPSVKRTTFQDLPDLTKVGDNWLFGATSLETVVIQNLPRLEEIGGWWLRKCTNLKEIDIKEHPELKTIGNYSVYGCTAVGSARVRNLPKLTSLGNSFLWGSTSLKIVEFSSLPELTIIGSYWMGKCSSLESFTVKDLPKLAAIQRCFLYDCASLKEATFQDLPELSDVGRYWLGDCPNLVLLKFENLPQLATIRSYFLSGTTDPQRRCEEVTEEGGNNADTQRVAGGKSGDGKLHRSMPPPAPHPEDDDEDQDGNAEEKEEQGAPPSLDEESPLHSSEISTEQSELPAPSTTTQESPTQGEQAENVTAAAKKVPLKVIISKDCHMKVHSVYTEVMKVNGNEGCIVQ